MAKMGMDREAFERICARHADESDSLSFEDIGDVFGAEFYIMMLYALMDSNDAARAIAGAIGKLKKGE